VLTLAGFFSPTAVAVDDQGFAYVTELNGNVQRIDPDGNVELITSGFLQPRGITVMPNGMLAVAETGNHAIWTVNPFTGVSTVIAGGNGRGYADGPGATALFNQPCGIAAAPNGALVVADRLNHRVRVIETNGNVRTLYGVPKNQWPSPFKGWLDGAGGPDGVAVGRDPVGVAVSDEGTLFVSEVHWDILRQVTGGGLDLYGDDGGTPGSGNTNTVVPPPQFAPIAGYYPNGVDVTVWSHAPVFYTTDGSEPTTNSRSVHVSGGVGTIRFRESLRDLTSLRLKAITNGVASVTVAGQRVAKSEIGVPRDVIAGSGSTLVLPVVLNAKTNERIRSVQFRVEVVPLNGAPPVLPQMRALSISSNDFIPVASAAAANTIGHFSASRYTIGHTNGLVITAIGTNANFDVRSFAAAAMLVVPLDPGVTEGQTYRVQVLYPSATSDGSQSSVELVPMPARLITVSNVPYLVGDSSFSGWYHAGDFGDGDLRNDDVNSVFYASLGVRLPLDFTDVFDAMDAYPPEPAGQGDGEIRFLDWQIILARSLRMDFNNWTRYWADGGVRVSDPAVLPGSAAPDRAKTVKSGKAAGASKSASTWFRPAKLSAGRIEQAIPGQTYHLPVSLQVQPGYSVAGLSFRASAIANNGAPGMPVGFTPWIGQGHFVGGSAVGPNEVLCGWSIVPSAAFDPGLQGSNLLGVLSFTVPPWAPAGQSYTIRFSNANGAADLNTPLAFESVPSAVWVAQSATGPAEIISDEWKVNFFGSFTDPDAQMFADPDNDSTENWEEYLHGTHPASAQ
jgi:hypothetical protein